jgi:tetratricopeptide (TPR) repeat protein
MARDFIDKALEKLEDKTSLAFASAVDLSGLIDLDMNNPSNALVLFNLALKVRENLLRPEDPLVASSFNNIALSYTEMGGLDSAHEKALSIRLQAETRVDNTYSNMSSLLLRMGKPNEAEEMMKKCPALKDFTDDSFINTGNPRYVGNMVLLSRIRLAQGRLDDAMRLASKALAFRQKFHGNGLKTCDSQYDVSDMLARQGHLPEAM